MGRERANTLVIVTCFLFVVSLIQLHDSVHSWLLCPFRMICCRKVLANLALKKKTPNKNKPTPQKNPC